MAAIEELIYFLSRLHKINCWTRPISVGNVPNLTVLMSYFYRYTLIIMYNLLLYSKKITKNINQHQMYLSMTYLTMRHVIFLV